MNEADSKAFYEWYETVRENDAGYETRAWEAALAYARAALSAAQPTTERPTQPGWYWIREPGEDWVVEHGIPAGTLWQRIPQPTEEGKA